MYLVIGGVFGDLCCNTTLVLLFLFGFRVVYVGKVLNRIDIIGDKQFIFL